MVNYQVSTFLPSYFQVALSWSKPFGGMLHLEEPRKAGLTSWLAVVGNFCAISGNFVQSSLGWEISGGAHGCTGKYVINVLPD